MAALPTAAQRAPTKLRLITATAASEAASEAAAEAATTTSVTAASDAAAAAVPPSRVAPGEETSAIHRILEATEKKQLGYLPKVD